MVFGGALIVLLVLNAVGLVPDGGRPLTESESKLYGGSVIQFYCWNVIGIAIFGLALSWKQWLVAFLSVGCLTWSGAPRWLVRIIGALFTAQATIMIVAPLGWHRDEIVPLLRETCIAFALAYGAWILPRLLPKGTAGVWRRAIGAAAIALAMAVWIYPWVPPLLHPQRLEVLLLRPKSTPPISAAPPQQLTDDQKRFLAAHGVHDPLYLGSRTVSVTGRDESGSTEGLARARMLIIATGPVWEKVEFYEPFQVDVLYLRQGDSWITLPTDHSTTWRKVRVTSDSDGSAIVDMRERSNAMTSYR
jgi:hypothetical protein